MKSEKKLGKEKINEFEALLGKNPDEAKYQEVASQIQEFYITCGTAHEHYTSELKSKFDDAPIDQAKVAISYYTTLKEALDEKDSIGLLDRFSQRPIEKLTSLINGGAQERGKRAGTEYTYGIVGMAAALKDAVNNIENN